MQSCGKLLKQLRKKHGLNQADLAKKLNISMSTLSTWESKDSLQVSTIKLVCDFFNITLSELFMTEKDKDKDNGANGIDPFWLEIGEMMKGVPEDLDEEVKTIILNSIKLARKSMDESFLNKNN